MRTRYQDFVDALRAAHRSQVAAAAQHLKSVNYLAGLGWIVVEKTNRRVLPVAVVSQFSQKQFATIACTIDEHAASGAVLRHRQNISKQTESQPAAGQQHQHKQSIKQKNRARKTLKTKRKQEHQYAKDRTNHHGLNKGDQIINAGVAPDAAINAQHQKRGHLEKDEHR